MKLKNKLLFGLASATIIVAPVATLVACGGETKKDITADGRFDVGLEANYMPYSFKATNEQIAQFKIDKNAELNVISKDWETILNKMIASIDGQSNKAVGFDIYMANSVAEKLHKETLVHIIPFNELISSVHDKKIDAAINAITKTEDRQKLVDFSAPYNLAHDAIIYNKSAQKPTSLEGKTIIFKGGDTIQERYIKTIPNVHMIPVKDSEEIPGILEADSDAIGIEEDKIAELHANSHSNLVEIGLDTQEAKDIYSKTFDPNPDPNHPHTAKDNHFIPFDNSIATQKNNAAVLKASNDAASDVMSLSALDNDKIWNIAIELANYVTSKTSR